MYYLVLRCFAMLTVCRWLHSRVVKDLEYFATTSTQQTLSVQILTGGSSGDELIPNSDISRNSYLHESVYVWLKGMLQLTAQQRVLSALKNEPSKCLTVELTKEQIVQIADHIVALTDSSTKMRQ